MKNILVFLFLKHDFPRWNFEIHLILKGMKNPKSMKD